MVGQALLRAPSDADDFANALAWRLRLWLLGLPAAIGLATLRSILKLWVGFSPATSGVHSAGNGPAMRAALLGLCLGNDPDRLRAYVRASTRLTHTDPRAERGALLIAVAAHYGAGLDQGLIDGTDFLHAARQTIAEPDAELLSLYGTLEAFLARNAAPAEFAQALGLHGRVGGYIYHSVPVALYCWLRFPRDFRRPVEEVIALGGDTDSTAALVGGLAGATLGWRAIPEEWIDGIWEWPRTVAWMRALAQCLADQFGDDQVPRSAELRLFWPGLIARNLAFFAIVILHVLRRLLPPY
jgi:ADP-ribosylglycohydrolase